jgi:uridine kinase
VPWCSVQLKAGECVEIPEYDFSTHQRAATTKTLQPASVVIIEGILVLHMEAIRNLLHMKVYVDTDDDVRLARRIQRDVACRGAPQSS